MANAISHVKVQALIDGLMNVHADNEPIPANQIARVIDALVKLCDIRLDDKEKEIWLTEITGKGAGIGGFVQSRSMLKTKLLKIEKIREDIPVVCRAVYCDCVLDCVVTVDIMNKASFQKEISWNGCIFTETLEIFIDDDSYVLKYHGKNFKTVVRDTDEGCNRAKEATLKCALFDGNSNGVNMKEKTLESLYKLDNVVNGCDDKENETIIMKHIIGEKCPTKFDFIQIEVNTNMEDGRI
ncbi:unnamed protein product [Rotaria socialis]|uniref:Uncharacterized protein n=1 Tax=Rotaria socialis TaxID=392032 RepID=A0A820GJN8_9BILA|nr:unnamed protein product [Rotaria socialis]